MVLAKKLRVAAVCLALVSGVAAAESSAPPKQASPFKQWLYWSQPDDYLRYTNTDLTTVKQENINGFDVVWWRDPLTGNTYPQITSGYNANTRTQLNNVLNAAMYTMPSKKGYCSEDSIGKATHEFSLIWVSPMVISYQIKEVLDCGAEGKQVLFSTQSIATENVKPLSIHDVLALRDIRPLPLIRNELAGFDQEVHKVLLLRDWLEERFSERYPQCGYFFYVDEGSQWSDDVWALTPQGIRFYPTSQVYDFHLRAVDNDDIRKTCRTEQVVVLPWSLLQANPGPLTKTVMP
ncbi:hypothetical protein [Dickeya lacustris]|uniref:Uncharacterized protein n=1 Tax=Dickeya lacustris TaxID=2259638 RepID=A0ABY8G9J8_9GAMM|nr:hypothetical protein [Dickeya lacustris]WFN56645.1 hypothetical protein O1Q98_05040 [Dickeya lacustris]